MNRGLQQKAHLPVLVNVQGMDVVREHILQLGVQILMAGVIALATHLFATVILGAILL